MPHPQCLSAVASCERLCEQCRAAHQAYYDREEARLVNQAIRVLEFRGYKVTPPAAK